MPMNTCINCGKSTLEDKICISCDEKMDSMVEEQDQIVQSGFVDKQSDWLFQRPISTGGIIEDEEDRVKTIVDSEGRNSTFFRNLIIFIVIMILLVLIS